MVRFGKRYGSGLSRIILYLDWFLMIITVVVVGGGKGIVTD